MHVAAEAVILVSALDPVVRWCRGAARRWRNLRAKSSLRAVCPAVEAREVGRRVALGHSEAARTRRQSWVSGEVGLAGGGIRAASGHSRSP